jgi:hypothetical protein
VYLSVAFRSVIFARYLYVGLSGAISSLNSVHDEKGSKNEEIINLGHLDCLLLLRQFSQTVKGGPTIIDKTIDIFLLGYLKEVPIFLEKLVEKMPMHVSSILHGNTICKLVSKRLQFCDLLILLALR